MNDILFFSPQHGSADLSSIRTVSPEKNIALDPRDPVASAVEACFSYGAGHACALCYLSDSRGNIVNPLDIRGDRRRADLHCAVAVNHDGEISVYHASTSGVLDPSRPFPPEGACFSARFIPESSGGLSLYDLYVLDHDENVSPAHKVSEKMRDGAFYLRAPEKTFPL